MVDGLGNVLVVIIFVVCFARKRLENFFLIYRAPLQIFTYVFR